MQPPMKHGLEHFDYVHHMKNIRQDYSLVLCCVWLLKVKVYKLLDNPDYSRLVQSICFDQLLLTIFFMSLRIFRLQASRLEDKVRPLLRQVPPTLTDFPQRVRPHKKRRSSDNIDGKKCLKEFVATDRALLQGPISNQAFQASIGKETLIKE